MVGTPCYLISEGCIYEAFARLQAMQTSVNLRHWLSLKTQPVARVVRVANELGIGIDVVSEFELASAIDAGFAGSRILVNGVGKHHWLPRRGIRNLSIHFDSLAEVNELAIIAREANWSVGLRCAIPETSVDSGIEIGALRWNQFGMTRDEVVVAKTLLSKQGVRVKGLHFHLHTSVAHVGHFRWAIGYVAEIAAWTGIEPDYIDIGGGLPLVEEASFDGVSTAGAFDIDEFRGLLGAIPSALPSVREVWLENGRYLTGPSGVLALTVLDRKQRGDRIYLICDGGRLNHARMAFMERHKIAITPARTGLERETVICGPTCTAADQLGCWMLPQTVVSGDRVIWHTAGAYHIPLETRFSQGLAPVVWFDTQNEPRVLRARESVSQWWGQWAAADDRRNVNG